MADNTITIAPGQIGAHEIIIPANTPYTFRFGNDVATIEVLSHDGAAIIYVTTNGDTPTLRGPQCYVVPAAMGTVQVPNTNSGPAVVKLIAAAPVLVSVTRVDP